MFLAGGVYYYRRNANTDEFFRLIFDELVPNYDSLNLNKQRGTMTDEALIDAAMAIKKMISLDSPKDIMKYHKRMMDTIKWNISKKLCTFIWWEGIEVAPDIVHYGTGNTLHKNYVYYNTLNYVQYKGYPRFLTPLFVIGNEVLLLFRHLNRKEDRDAFWQWFKAHFTKEHFRFRKQQIKDLLNGDK